MIMPNVEFQKKFKGKNVKVFAQTHVDADREKWGVRSLCPWCGKAIQVKGYSTPKKAASGFFQDLEYHYNKYH